MSSISSGIDRGRLAGGAALLVLGLVLTADRLHLAPLSWLYPLWPTALMAAGVALGLAGPARRREGAWLTGVGGWLLANNLGHFGALEIRFATSWPLLVILAGLIGLILPKPGEARLDGLTPLVVGIWLQANMLHLYGMSFRNSWPLLLVLLGLAMVARALRQASVPEPGRTS
jgi:hypothetical protein